eukprot:Rmarinus@m.28196
MTPTSRDDPLRMAHRSRNPSELGLDPTATAFPSSSSMRIRQVPSSPRKNADRRPSSARLGSAASLPVPDEQILQQLSTPEGRRELESVKDPEECRKLLSLGAIQAVTDILPPAGAEPPHNWEEAAGAWSQAASILRNLSGVSHESTFVAAGTAHRVCAALKSFLVYHRANPPPRCGSRSGSCPSTPQSSADAKLGPWGDSLSNMDADVVTPRTPSSGHTNRWRLVRNLSRLLSWLSGKDRCRLVLEQEDNIACILEVLRIRVKDSFTAVRLLFTLGTITERNSAVGMQVWGFEGGRPGTASTMPPCTPRTDASGASQPAPRNLLPRIISYYARKDEELRASSAEGTQTSSAPLDDSFEGKRPAVNQRPSTARTIALPGADHREVEECLAKSIRVLANVAQQAEVGSEAANPRMLRILANILQRKSYERHPDLILQVVGAIANLAFYFERAATAEAKLVQQLLCSELLSLLRLADDSIKTGCLSEYLHPVVAEAVRAFANFSNTPTVLQWMHDERVDRALFPYLAVRPRDPSLAPSHASVSVSVGVGVGRGGDAESPVSPTASPARTPAQPDVDGDALEPVCDPAALCDICGVLLNVAGVKGVRDVLGDVAPGQSESCIDRLVVLLSVCHDQQYLLPVLCRTLINYSGNRRGEAEGRFSIQQAGHLCECITSIMDSWRIPMAEVDVSGDLRQRERLREGESRVRTLCDLCEILKNIAEDEAVKEVLKRPNGCGKESCVERCSSLLLHVTLFETSSLPLIAALYRVLRNFWDRMCPFFSQTQMDGLHMALADLIASSLDQADQNDAQAIVDLFSFVSPTEEVGTESKPPSTSPSELEPLPAPDS